MKEHLEYGDYLDIRDNKGNSLHRNVRITGVTANLISTMFGVFRIPGYKNIAGVECFDHVLTGEEFPTLHAVRSLCL